MIVHLERLHSFLLQGESKCHVFEAAPACSGGKVFKNCHHQVSLWVVVYIIVYVLYCCILERALGHLCYQVHPEKGKHLRPS